MPTPVQGRVSTATDSSTTPSWSHIVDGGRNRALLVCITLRGTREDTGCSSSIDGALTHIRREGGGSGNGGRRVSWYRLVSPAVGTHTITVTTSSGTAANWHGVCRSLTDVDQTTPIGAVDGWTASGTHTGTSLSLTTVSGDLVFDGVCYNASGFGSGSNQAVGPAYSLVPAMATSTRVATGTTTAMSHTWSSTTNAAGHVAFVVNGDDTGSPPSEAAPSGTTTNHSVVMSARPGDPEPGGASTSYVMPIGISPESAAAGNESRNNTRFPVAGTITRIGIRTTSNAASASSTLTLREDGADTALVVTVPAGDPAGVGRFDASGSVAVDPAKSYAFRVTNGAGGAIAWDQTWAVFVPDDGAVCASLVAVHGSGSNNIGPGTTVYWHAHGQRTTDSTLAVNSFPVPLSGNLSYYQVVHAALTRSFDSTFDLLVDQSASGQSLVYGPSDNAILVDTGSDAVSRGQRLNHRLITGAGTGAMDVERLSAWLSSSGSRAFLAAGSGSGGLTVTASTGSAWMSVTGHLLNAASEAQAQIAMPVAATITAFWVDVRLNSLSGNPGTDTVVTLRKNGSDTNLQITVGRGDVPRTYWELYDAVDVAAGDLLAVRLVHNTGSGDVRISSCGIVYAPLAPSGGAPTLSDLQAVSITSTTVQGTYDYAF